MIKKHKINAIIPAGGTSVRFGNKNKLLEKINGKEVIYHTVKAFDCEEIDEIIVCAHASIIEEFETVLKYFDKVKIIQGGDTRQQSVFNGLQSSECDFVLIHDGARPMITSGLVTQAIDMVVEKNALTVATKTIDTIKEVENGVIVKTIERAKLYNTQTPQAFRYEKILLAHKQL